MKKGTLTKRELEALATDLVALCQNGHLLPYDNEELAEELQELVMDDIYIDKDYLINWLS